MDTIFKNLQTARLDLPVVLFYHCCPLFLALVHECMYIVFVYFCHYQEICLPMHEMQKVNLADVNHVIISAGLKAPLYMAQHDV